MLWLLASFRKLLKHKIRAHIKPNLQSKSHDPSKPPLSATSVHVAFLLVCVRLPSRSVASGSSSAVSIRKCPKLAVGPDDF